MSGGSNGRMRVSSALHRKQVHSVSLAALSFGKAINALAFTPDGAKVSIS